MSTSTSQSWTGDAKASGAEDVRRPPRSFGGWPLGIVAILVVGIPITAATLLFTHFDILGANGNASSVGTAPPPADPAEVLAVGGVPIQSLPTTGIISAAPAEEPVEPAQPESYTVQAGDTIAKIARNLGIDARALAAYNELANPNILSIGQVLRIPPADYQAPAGQGISPPPATQPPATDPPPAEQDGDATPQLTVAD